MYTIIVIIVLYFYVRLGIWAANKASANFEDNAKKWSIRIAIALVFILIPTGDSIVGQIYFNHLCETEAGAKVHQTIELPAEYWDEDGKPKFYDERTGNSSPTFDITQYADVETKRKLHLLGIQERTTVLVDKTTHKIISTNTLFRYWGGWVKKNLSLHNTADHCGGESKDLINKLFVAEKNRVGE